jgi:parallel beta-helix repeat protein
VEYWWQNINTDNLVNEKPLGYFWNLTGGYIDGILYGQVILANCTGVTVENSVIYNIDVGITIGFSSYCSVINNSVSECEAGMIINKSSNNTVVNNTLTFNTENGMSLLSSSDNLIFLNKLGHNIIQNAYDDGGTGNHWNSTGTGNYWSDYYGTGVYSIPGGAGSIDYHPFIFDTTAPTIDQPDNIEYEEGTTGNSITWTPSDAYPFVYMILQNSSALESDTWDGNSITVNIDSLSAGVYNYTIVVYDLSMNWIIDTVIVTVLPQTTTTTTITTDTSTTDTTTIMTTTTTSSTTSPSPVDNGSPMVLAISAAAGVVVVLVLVVILRKKG